MVVGILFLVYLFFGRVTPWLLAVTITLLLGRQRNIWGGLILVILMGIVEDVAGVRILGLSSALLLCLWGVVWIIERQYRGQWVWWYAVAGGGEVLIRWTRGEVISWQSILWQIAILWLVRRLLKRVQQPEGIYVGR